MTQSDDAAIRPFARASLFCQAAAATKMISRGKVHRRKLAKTGCGSNATNPRPAMPQCPRACAHMRTHVECQVARPDQMSEYSCRFRRNQRRVVIDHHRPQNAQNTAQPQDAFPSARYGLTRSAAHMSSQHAVVFARPTALAGQGHALRPSTKQEIAMPHKTQDTVTPRALWICAPGEARLLPADIGSGDLLQMRYSAISRGTERLVLSGNVPTREQERMRAALSVKGPVQAFL